jgi:hypothetical protein
VKRAIEEYVAALAKAQAERVESDLAHAVALQDFDKLDRLCVVHDYRLGWSPPAVASMLTDPIGSS